MSLLIKGMDMPYNCAACPLRNQEFFKGKKYLYGCGLCKGWGTGQTRADDCPLVEVPTPRGRLIDADAHIQSLKENQCGERCRKNHDCVNCGIGMYIRIVENEPAIIEAEGNT